MLPRGSMRFLVRFLALVGLVALVALFTRAGTAHAQPDNRAKAKAAFARAVDAEERQDWRTAVDEYLTAYELAPHHDVLFNVATVYERLNELRQAATYYARYLEDAPDAGDRAKVQRTIDGLRKKPSQVTIETAPAGATIIVDGERKGRAPLELKLPGGAHQIVAEHAGTTSTRMITVEYGEPAAVTLAVGGNGTLVVTSNEPGSTVRLDGNPVGVTPFTGGVTPGRHIVIVEKPGFTTVERVVDVPPDGTAQITAGMVRPLGYIEPQPQTKNMGILLGGDGGTTLVEGTPVSFDLTFGWRSAGKRADIYTGVAFGGGGVGYAFGLRLFVLTGRVRPYLGAGASLITANGNARGVGGIMLADLGTGRTAWDLHVEAGVASVYSSTDERLSGPFVLAGVVWHLRNPAPDAAATGR